MLLSTTAAAASSNSSATRLAEVAVAAAGAAAAAASEESAAAASRKVNKYYYWEFGQTTGALIIFCMIVVGNLSILHRLKSCRRRRSNVNYFIIQLAIADLFVGFFSVTLDSILRLQKSFPYGLIACRASKYISVLFIYSSTFLLVALSIDRWEAVVRPLAFTQNRNHGFYLVVGAWCLALLCATPVTINTNIQEVDGLKQCWVQYSKTGWKIYMIYLTSSLLVVPAIIIAICYTHIVYTIWRRGQSVIQTGRQPSAAGVSSGACLKSSARGSSQAQATTAATPSDSEADEISEAAEEEEVATREPQSSNISTDFELDSLDTVEDDDDDDEHDEEEEADLSRANTSAPRDQEVSSRQPTDHTNTIGHQPQLAAAAAVEPPSSSSLHLLGDTEAVRPEIGRGSSRPYDVVAGVSSCGHDRQVISGCSPVRNEDDGDEQWAGKTQLAHKYSKQQQGSRHKRRRKKQVVADSGAPAAPAAPRQDEITTTNLTTASSSLAGGSNDRRRRQTIERRQKQKFELAAAQQQHGNGVIPKARIKTIKMTFVIVVAFILCWLPFCIINLCGVFGLMKIDTHFAIALLTFTQSLAHLNSAVNPIIFWIFSSKRSSGQNRKGATRGAANNKSGNATTMVAPSSSRFDKRRSTQEATGTAGVLAAAVSSSSSSQIVGGRWRNNVRRMFCWSHYVCGLFADCCFGCNCLLCSQRRRRAGTKKLTIMEQSRRRQSVSGAGPPISLKLKRTIGAVLVPVVSSGTSQPQAEDGCSRQQQQQQQQDGYQISRILIQ